MKPGEYLAIYFGDVFAALGPALAHKGAEAFPKPAVGMACHASSVAPFTIDSVRGDEIYFKRSATYEDAYTVRQWGYACWPANLKQLPCNMSEMTPDRWATYWASTEPVAASDTVPCPPPTFHASTTYRAPDGTELLRGTEFGGVYVRGQLAASPLDVADAMRAYCVGMTERTEKEFALLQRQVENAVRENGAMGRDMHNMNDRHVAELAKERAEKNWYQNELQRHDPRLVAAHERNRGK